LRVTLEGGAGALLLVLGIFVRSLWRRVAELERRGARLEGRLAELARTGFSDDRHLGRQCCRGRKEAGDNGPP
jgi:hypothetical protein